MRILPNLSALWLLCSGGSSISGNQYPFHQCTASLPISNNVGKRTIPVSCPCGVCSNDPHNVVYYHIVAICQSEAVKGSALSLAGKPSAMA